MRLLIEFEGNPAPVGVDIDARDRRAFEKSGFRDIGVSQRAPIRDIAAAQPETYTTWLAWHAMVRSGATVERYADFEARVVALREEDADDAADLLGDPTAPATSGG